LFSDIIQEKVLAGRFCGAGEKGEGDREKSDCVKKIARRQSPTCNLWYSYYLHSITIL
jgi:hypothetical protein